MELDHLCSELLSYPVYRQWRSIEMQRFTHSQPALSSGQLIPKQVPVLILKEAECIYQGQSRDAVMKKYLYQADDWDWTKAIQPITKWIL